MAHYIPTDRRLSIAKAALALDLSIARVRALIVDGRLRAILAASPNPQGPRRQMMLDALDVFALRESRLAHPWKAGRPKKTISPEVVA